MVKFSARWVARKFWGVLALAVILTAVLVQIGRELAPAVSSYSDVLTEYLSSRIDGDIHLQDISLTWDSLSPTLSIQGFEVIPNDAPAALSAAYAEVQVDILASLLGGTLKLKVVDLSSVVVRLVQSANGVWGLSGLLSSTVASSESPIDDPLDVFLLVEDVRLNNVNLLLSFRNGDQLEQAATSITLQNDGDFHRLSVQMGGAPKPSIEVVFEGVGDPRDRTAFQGEGFVALNQYPIDQIPFLSHLSDSLSTVQQSLLSAQLWLSSSPGQALKLVGHVDYNTASAGQLTLPDSVRAQVFGSWQAQLGWELALQDVQIDWPLVPGESAPTLEPFHLTLQGGYEKPDLVVGASKIDLTALGMRLQNVAMLPEKARTILNELSVTGVLDSARITIPIADPKSFRLQAKLEDVAVNDWKGAPAVQGLFGYVDAGVLDGVVTIDAADDFYMHFPMVYEDPFVFQSAQGRVAWQVKPETNQVLVNSGLLQMQGPLGSTAGYFYLDAPIKRNSRLSELVLQIGLRDGQVRDHVSLVPHIIPDSLEEWLDRSLLDGDVPSGGFLFRGLVGRSNMPKTGNAIQLSLDVERGVLDYQEGWPAVKEVTGSVGLDDRWVSADITSGSLLGLQVTNAQVATTPSPSGKGLLNIKGRLQGAAQSGLSLLLDTPIRAQLGSAFDAWDLQGELLGAVDLRIPLSSEDKEHQSQNVQVSFHDASLFMSDINLNFAKLNGTLSFSKDNGLLSDDLTTQLWGRPVDVAVRSDWRGPLRTTEVSFSADAPIDALAQWSQRPELKFFTGEAAVTGTVIVTPGQPAKLDLASDLVGAAVSLPYPFGKEASDARSLTLSMLLGEAGQEVELSYGDILGVELELPKGQAVTGVVRVGGASESTSSVDVVSPQALDQPQIRVKGGLQHLDLQAWEPPFQKYVAYLHAGEGAASMSAAIKFDLAFERLNFGELTLESLAVRGGQADGGWLVQLENEKIFGSVSVTKDQPLQVQVDYIRWDIPVPETPDQAAIPWLKGLVADVDRNQIPAMNLSINEISLNGKAYGSWSGHFHVDHQGFYLQQLKGSVRGVDIFGENDSEGAQLSWMLSDTESLSSFQGRLRAKRLAGVIDNWGLPPTLEAERADVLLNAEWPGDPLQFSLLSADATSQFEFRKGRFYSSPGQASSTFLRLVGLFNFDGWVQRLRLDFSDVYSKGTPFESVTGTFSLDDGVLHLTEPVEVKNTSSRLQMGGNINLRNETIDTSLVATLPTGGNATFVTAMAVGLPAAAGVYIASKLFKDQVDKVSSLSYKISGTWTDPKIRFDKLFDNKSAEGAAKKSQDEVEQKGAVQ